MYMTTEVTEPVDNGGTQTPAGTEPPNGGKTFTQEEVDALIDRRLARTKAQYKDYDELKASAQRLAELESQNQTETERLRAEAEKAKQDHQAAAEREQSAAARANTILKRSAVIAEASRRGTVDPEAVFALTDVSKLEIGDDDTVAGVQEAVEAVLSSRKYLLPNGGQGGGFDGGSQGAPAHGQSSNADFNARLRQAAGF
jgi:uncharacterized protein involved in type VI secretion and phage assembly